MITRLYVYTYMDLYINLVSEYSSQNAHSKRSLVKPRSERQVYKRADSAAENLVDAQLLVKQQF